MSKKSIEKELSKLDAEYSAFYSLHHEKVTKVKEKYKRLTHVCVGCSNKTKLGDLIVVVEEYCPDPESTSYSTDTRYLICPHCLLMNRFYNEKSKEDFVEDLKVYKEVLYWLPSPYSYHFSNKLNLYGTKAHLDELKYKNAK